MTSVGWQPTFLLAPPASRNSSPSPHQRKVTTMPPAKVPVESGSPVTTSRLGTVFARGPLLSGVSHGRISSPTGSSPTPIHLALSPIPTWNSLADSSIFTVSHNASTSANARVSAKATTSTPLFGNAKAVPPPTRPPRISYASSASTNGFIDTFPGLTTYRGPPISSRTRSRGISTPLSQLSLIPFLTFFRRRLVVKCGRRQTSSFPRSPPPCCANSVPRSLFWPCQISLHRLASVARLHL